MIPQATIERIMDAANIVDVVSEYVTLRRSGASYKGLCPFHDDKTPSFFVSPAKGLCKCFSCGQGGNAVHFIMELEQLSYYEALKFLAKKYGIEVEERELTPEQKRSNNERESMFAVNEWASSYFNNLLKNNADGKAIGMAYFRSRGFRDDIIEKFRLGFSLDQWDALSKEAKVKGYKEDYLVKTGLCYRKDDGRLNDRFRGRVMFPWINVSGKVVAFGGRVLDARTKGVNQKYVNSPESEIYSKAKELYGIFQAKKQIAKEDRVYMVEGYTDVISMHQCGIENVVANSGTALSTDQIRLLHRFTNNITLLYDGDAAGIHAALRGTDMLLAEGMNVKILLLPDGDDPDSFARKHNATEFRDYVEKHQTDFIIFKTNLLLGDAGHDPIKRANLTKDIVKSISVIPEEIIRSTYIHECSEILNIDEKILLNEIQKNRQAAIEEVRKEAERERERARYLAEKEAASAPDGKNESSEKQQAEVITENKPVSEIQTAAPTGETHIASDVMDIRRTTAEDKKFYELEHLIMRVIARFGEKIISGSDDDGNELAIPFLKYVYNELAEDGLSFRTPVYAKMLNEAVSHVDEENFITSKFFSYNPDLEISREAANLLSDKYKLSEKKEEKEGEDISEEEAREISEMQALEDAVTKIIHLILDYKLAVIEAELKRKTAQLSNPEITKDQDKCAEIMQEYMKICNIRNELAKQLGERIYRRR